MPTFVYRCPTHGKQEIVKPMARASAPEHCWFCLAAYQQVGSDYGSVLPPLARVWDRTTVPAVQNHSKSEGGLVSWGQDERAVRVHKDVWLAEERHNRLEYGPQED